ncbi:tetratricopeptide repeat protein [Corallococcus macrosporus]|uniref:Tetratricopeptide repeat protein n=1 Tax=Corallococcus macrosporus TaxID=35 RepID=A0ABS3D4W1_9BACT|nr:tetratricopeptide repeat protein [Corallococcus macrosporus]MBN8226702.1 tetratricopeptide repeat protein [Corallococcus macrosporus]
MPRSLVCLVLLTLSVACRTAAPVAPDAVQVARTPAAAEWEKRLDAVRFAPASPAQQQTFAQIQRELEAAVQKDPADAHLHYLLGRVYFYQERDAEAARELDRALELAPEVAEYHYLKGYFFGVVQDRQGAIAELTRATELAPRVAKYQAVLGETLLTVDEARAVTAFLRALELEPDNALSAGYLGLMLLAQGKEEEGLRWLAKTTTQSPSNPMTQYNIAQAYQNHGDHERALAHFQAAARDMPEDWRTLAKLVQEHEALKQFKERDAARARLLKLNDEGKVDSPFFVREQFQEGAAKVMVTEHFKLEGDWAVRYTFHVEEARPGAAPVEWRLSLGSYAFTNELRPPGVTERTFHFDGYEADHSHLTFAFFRGEPSYEDTRKLAVAVLRGEVKPVSGTRFNRE